MNIRDIENTLIQILKSKFSNLLIQGFPEKPQEFVLLHPVGAILVHYQGGSYSTSDSLFTLTQEKNLEFAITVITRNLRANEGAYETLDKVRETLSGYQIIGCSKLTPTKENFISEINGIWQYEIRFKITTPSIENLEEEGE